MAIRKLPEWNYHDQLSHIYQWLDNQFNYNRLVGYIILHSLILYRLRPRMYTAQMDTVRSYLSDNNSPPWSAKS